MNTKLTVKESKGPLRRPVIDSADQRELTQLKFWKDRIYGDLDDAAHFMGMGTPSYACTHQEVLDGLSKRVNELDDIVKQQASALES